MGTLMRAPRSTGACGLVLILSTAISGCQSMGPPKQALDTGAISVVQSEIKRQVGVYARASQSKLPVKAGEFACGNGKLDFDISTVKAELTVTTDRTSKTGLTLGIPWNGATIAPSGEATKGTTNTQVLTYNLWLADSNLQEFTAANKSPVTNDELGDAPIAQVLLSLREALINGAKNSSKGPQPCFTGYNPEKPAADAGNTFKLGLTYVKSATTGLQIKLGIVDLTASTEWKSNTGNTLTVAFVQRGLADLQRARNAVDVECKYPKTEADDSCKNALKKFKDEQNDAGGTFIPPSTPH